MKITAPGKLMLSGEWSVLELGVPCIVMAIDKKVSAEINPSKELVFKAPGMGLEEIKGSFEGSLVLNATDEEKQKLLFVSKAVEGTLKYLKDSGKELKNFSLETLSGDTVVELAEGKTAKVGFGSSAAVVAATVAAVMAFHGEDISSLETKQKIYKLGCIAHYLAQGKVGSSFDVAASTFGKALVYQKPDTNWLVEQLASNMPINQLVESEWPYLKTEPIELPENFNLSVGFVGYSASTKELVLKLKDYKTEKKEEYQKIVEDIKATTEKMIDALKSSNQDEVLKLVRQNRVLLKDFSEKSNNNLETKELALLADLADKVNAAGKFSGAGGGDCGIAISFDSETKQKVEDAWKENNIYPIDAGVSDQGVDVE